ncbi:hypothetical protein [Snodgrassella gandavensis]|uniref:hypothetical protein n=1 Tax=Snodgrassella gandavensis TaxID=2946698 RepID=UPI001EF5811A|nr:hypothetical protein [Snodgrassella gandavensis]
MQIHRAKPILFIVTGLSMLLTGCSISDWYNGYYVERSSMKKYLRDVNAYYDAESPEMKELRKKNRAYCFDLASKPENRVVEKGYENRVFNTPMYISCLEERGTPTYATYEAKQEEQRRTERRARGRNSS